MKIAEKAYRDASVRVFNLSVAIRDRSPQQAEIINGWLHDLNDRLDDIQRTLALERPNQER